MDLVSSEIPVLEVHRWCPFAVYAHGRRGEGAFWGSFYKGSCPHVLITSTSLYLLVLSPRGLGFNIGIQIIVQPNYSAIIFLLLECLETSPMFL